MSQRPVLEKAVLSVDLKKIGKILAKLPFEDMAWIILNSFYINEKWKKEGIFLEFDLFLKEHRDQIGQRNDVFVLERVHKIKYFFIEYNKDEEIGLSTITFFNDDKNKVAEVSEYEGNS